MAHSSLPKGYKGGNVGHSSFPGWVGGYSSLPTMVARYPSWYTHSLLPGLYTGVYRPPCTWSGQYMSYMRSSTARSCQGCPLHQQFPPSPVPKWAFLTSGITVSPRRNPSITSNNSDTESHFAQGMSKPEEVVRSVLPPPSRL